MKNNVRGYLLVIACIMWYMLYPTVELICYSLVTHNTGHLSTCVFVISVPSSVRHLSTPLTQREKFTRLEICGQYTFSLFRLHGEA